MWHIPPARRATLVLLVVLAALAGGCAQAEEPEGSVSAWPRAERERVVAQPPQPLRWPLTGLEAPDATAIARRVVSIKIENSPAARPQTSLQLADVVYESIAEGGITRFNAIFHSQLPKDVGPVRSARLGDLHIVPQYGALFIFSGASGPVNAAVNASSIDNMSQDAGVSYPYYRSRQRSAPHNLYVTFDKIFEEAGRRGMAVTQKVAGLTFEAKRSEAATPTVTEVSIPFSTANRVKWTYDAGSDTYLRENNGAKHTDAATGDQLSAKNVVVLWARHEAATMNKGSMTYRIDLRGSGRCSVFRNGQRYDGTWEAGDNAPPTFKAADGSQIKLASGNTWFQVIQTSINITMK